MSLFRILLVEDFEPFRRFVRLTLQPRVEFSVVGEALDGLEAVQLAKELQPDLILMDIGLPKLNGIAAAEQIRHLAPFAKILFVSLESSADAVQAAFRAGARGYIHKLRAHDDLMPAIEAVLAGKQFVSSDLQFSEDTHVHRHEILFYSDDMVYLESATQFITGALRTSGAAIAVVTESHGKSILQRLQADGFDMDREIQQGAYISLDVTEMLSKFMVNGLPDEGRLSAIMNRVIGSAIKGKKTEGSRVAVFGECAGLLYAEGNTNGAIQMEKKGNDRQRAGVDFMCAYPLSAFQHADGERMYRSICAEHTAVYSR